MRTRALTHVAMAVRPGALTPPHRRAILDFYGDVFGWRELPGLSTPTRLTIAIGPGCYLNVREHDAATDLTYEHFGVLVDSADDVHELREEIVRRGVEADPVDEPVAGHPTFRFHHLLPMAIEVQYFP